MTEKSKQAIVLLNYCSLKKTMFRFVYFRQNKSKPQKYWKFIITTLFNRHLTLKSWNSLGFETGQANAGETSLAATIPVSPTPLSG